MIRVNVDGICAALGAWLAPRLCHLCRMPAVRDVCGGCEQVLPWNSSACHYCAMPLLPTGVTACTACLKDTPPQDSTWAAFRYEAPIASRIVSLKFAADLASAQILGGLMARALACRAAPLPEVLIPVPLHSWRLRRRGYNQALEIARVMVRSLAIELAPGAAFRVRRTREQTALTASERRANLRSAFRVSDAVRGRRVALLDDVITTGATMAELARAARKAGAARVEAWAVARA